MAGATPRAVRARGSLVRNLTCVVRNTTRRQPHQCMFVVAVAAATDRDMTCRVAVVLLMSRIAAFSLPLDPNGPVYSQRTNQSWWIHTRHELTICRRLGGRRNARDGRPQRAIYESKKYHNHNDKVALDGVTNPRYSWQRRQVWPQRRPDPLPYPWL
jgi:hypothetical protein